MLRWRELLLSARKACSSLVAPYCMSVPHRPVARCVCQYRTARSTISGVGTTPPVAPYCTSVPHRP
eukprot:2977376-Rhodomonas_salina.2